jgi:hypothetical protein
VKIRIASQLALVPLVIVGLGLAVIPASASATPPDFRHACSATPPPGRAECLALVRTNVASHLGVVAGLTPAGYGPASLQSAYNLATAAKFSGRGQTVALVDAFDDPNAESDLAVYRSQYHLPACTSGDGCFAKVNQTGGTSYPSPDPGWAVEMSLDLDMVSAICPNCHILLVEANDNGLANLGSAVNEAVARGAEFVSNSYGAGEFSGEGTYDSDFYAHPGVAVTASAGDSGYGTLYPAASAYVTAVGGTSLTQAPNARGWSETAWAGTGSGCSAYEFKPPWQTDTGCSNRTMVDVSADADPNTGAAIYDSYQQSGWLEVGGTSEASPIIAAVYALAGTPTADTYPSYYPYAHPGSLYDVTSGSNGACGTYLCNGEVGYDGPTGLGTPDGVNAFKLIDNSITVTNPGTHSSTKGKPIGPVTVHATDTDTAQVLTYSATGLPSGLSISAAGVISGKPAATGISTVTVTAADDTGAAGSARFTWVVSAKGAIKSGLSATRCVTDQGGKLTNGNPVQIAHCTGGAAQLWIIGPLAGGKLVIHLNKGAPAKACVSVKGGKIASGTKVVSSKCVPNSSQEWKAGPHGHLIGVRSGKCLTDPGSGPNGTQLTIAACKNTASEHWNLP